MDIEKLRRKRGRKSKKEIEFIKKYEIEHQTSFLKTEEKKPKKRGRKPKGGKIIPQPVNGLLDDGTTMPNIILHLKCSENDLNESKHFLNEMKYNPTIENVQPYNMNETIEHNGLQYYDIEVNVNNDHNNSSYNANNFSRYTEFNNVQQNSQHQEGNAIHYPTSQSHNTQMNKNNQNQMNTGNFEHYTQTNVTNGQDSKIIWEKLKSIQQMLHTNNCNNKNSCCFRCTYEFDNPAVLIPMYELNGEYKGYGCFCTPECAAGFLFDENIESSIKWERYGLLNTIYKPIYNYAVNIKPSLSPFYLLEKYYGNLTIEEYREMNKKSSYGILMMVNKPLTRVMPELFTDNNEYVDTNTGKSQYKLSRKKPPINKTVVNDKTWLF